MIYSLIYNNNIFYTILYIIQYQAGVPRHMWISGGALRPYYEDVQHIVSLKDTIPEFRGYKIVDTDNLSFDHCPIIDCGVTDDNKVLSLAMKLVKDISEGEIVYLHCWGGHGRTGTVVCIMLHLLYGVSNSITISKNTTTTATTVTILFYLLLHYYYNYYHYHHYYS